MTRIVTLLAALAAVSLVGCEATETQPSSSSSSSPSAATTAPADELAVQALSDACLNASYEACDQLWSLSSVGSESERIGASCGGRINVGDDAPFGDCVSTFGESAQTTGSANPIPESSDVITSTVTPTETTPPPDRAFLIDPQSGRWVVIVASLSVETDGSLERALDEAERLRTAHDVAGAGVFDSTDFASLNPGFWVVYTGQFDGSDQARSACSELLEQGIVADCYQRLVDTVATE